MTKRDKHKEKKDRTPKIFKEKDAKEWGGIFPVPEEWGGKIATVEEAETGVIKGVVLPDTKDWAVVSVDDSAGHISTTVDGVSTSIYAAPENLYFILEGKKVVPCNNVLEWSKFLQDKSRIVFRNEIGNDIAIYTTFIGLNAHFTNKSIPPAVFETMVFGGNQDGYQLKAATWEEAEKNHKYTYEMVVEDLDHETHF